MLLASTSGAIVIGFHVRPTGEARGVAEREDVDIRLYNIIYEAVEEVRAAMEGLLAPEEREVMLGTAEVRQLFKVPRVGTVAGCMVTSGVMDRRGKVRVIRDAVQVYEGELGSLKRFKDDVERSARGLRVRPEHRATSTTSRSATSSSATAWRRWPARWPASPPSRSGSGASASHLDSALGLDDGACVGVVVWELQIPGCQSLKEKR